ALPSGHGDRDRHRLGDDGRGGGAPGSRRGRDHRVQHSSALPRPARGHHRSQRAAGPEQEVHRPRQPRTVRHVLTWSQTTMIQIAMTVMICWTFAFAALVSSGWRTGWVSRAMVRKTAMATSMTPPMSATVGRVEAVTNLMISTAARRPRKPQ